MRETLLQRIMKLDALIVLGAGLTKKWTLPKEAKERCNKAIGEFHKHNPKYIIVSGKYSYKLKKKPHKTEAKLMKEFLESKGIPSNKILTEKHSKDTFGNAYFTRQYIIDPKRIKNIAIITSDYHIPKAAFLFRKIYGKQYTLHFIAARSSHGPKQLQRLKTREKIVRRILTTYLSSIKDGDMKSLKKYLYNTHPIYKSKKGPAVEMLIRLIKVLEPKK